MERFVDTVVIGGGPAGLACAVTLQRAGIENLVVEKRVFPRDKTCGGLLTEKTAALLDKIFGIDSAKLSVAACEKIDKIALFSGCERLTESTVSSPFYTVRRKNFDQLLANIYKNFGGNLLEGTTCRSFDTCGKSIVLSDGEVVRFKHLVVADGALSPTAATLGYKKSKLGFCMETHILKSRFAENLGLGIYFGIVKNGYAWVFPAGDTYCVGLGGVYEKGIAYKGIFKKFLFQLGVSVDDSEIKGAFVPYGGTVKQKGVHADVILVGDAGGFVDPIYGEGLYFALATGLAAAEAVINVGRKKTVSLEKEFACLSSEYANIVWRGARLQKIFYSSLVQKAFCAKVKGKNAFVGFYCDNQLARYNYSYNELFKLYADYKKNKRKKR